jgi:hypothetical protein
MQISEVGAKQKARNVMMTFSLVIGMLSSPSIKYLGIVL